MYRTARGTAKKKKECKKDAYVTLKYHTRIGSKTIWVLAQFESKSVLCSSPVVALVRGVSALVNVVEADATQLRTKTTQRAGYMFVPTIAFWVAV